MYKIQPRIVRPPQLYRADPHFGPCCQASQTQQQLSTRRLLAVEGDHCSGSARRPGSCSPYSAKQSWPELKPGFILTEVPFKRCDCLWKWPVTAFTLLNSLAFYASVHAHAPVQAQVSAHRNPLRSHAVSGKTGNHSCSINKKWWWR